MADGDDTVTEYYPNVQGVKNKQFWIKYITKEDKQPYEHGIIVAQYIEASVKKTKVLGKRLISGERLEDIVQEEDNAHMILQFDKYQRAISAYRLTTEKAYTSEGTRGIWFVGPPGTGKSRKARDISLAEFNEEPFILTGGKWFDGYRGQKMIIIDDLDKYTAHQLGHSIKLWADRYPVTAEVKGATIPL